ncbi:MAG TPA: hypothetical protein VMV10_27715 [Pirellulales bacterium]|nr:hypothetical protein [Pirellulales bacterium]
MLRSEWLAGALVVLAIGLVALDVPGERAALETVERLGGKCGIEPRFGLECLGVIVKVELAECAPTARDLAQFKHLRHLRVLDLSRTPIGDRELVQLADSRCPFIIVPNGQTSEAVRNLFDEDQLALGLGLSEIVLPGTDTSMPATGSADLGNVRRTADSLAGKPEISVERTRLKGYGG